ncbi:Bug family tripartite tricarboxylate transporter substrate binding protein [Paracandidimonas soli]|uniref:Tripartite-type tricarboxylate transporter receptor subunit TctC n=1 Tax=Paracandidimonas soli TaxID=1917182 RepID=A0A4R3UV62_9BURK|nr:tripartite tricarboxylate transporter substrate binding protein [Paracandidimonas soli]TCU94458.1 tripartite-type tricarboxylate transporter receptor subunit TctC [Paracandidimonas soli]
MVKNTMQWLKKCGISACLSGMMLTAAHASSAPLEFIVPYPPGGASDIIVRALAPHLSKATGRNVVVTNRGGANTAIAAMQLARSAPDGNTIMLADVALALNSVVRKQSPGYDVEKDFTPIIQIGSAPLVLFTASTSHSDLPSFLEKGRKEELHISNAGPGSLGHLAAELLRLRSGLNIVSVPYRGSGPALNETLGGQVDAIFTSTATGMPLVENKQLNALAVADDKKVDKYPDIPTFDSFDIQGVKAINWWGLIAPAGLDQATVKQLAEAVRTAMAEPELKQRFDALGINPTLNEGDAFAAMIRQELDQWERVVKEADIQMD